MSIPFRAGLMSLVAAALLSSTPVLADGSKLDEVLARGHLVLGTGTERIRAGETPVVIGVQIQGTPCASAARAASCR